MKSGSPVLLTLATVLAGCGSGISSPNSHEAWSVTLDQRFVDPYPGVAAGNFICFAYDAKWPRDDDHRDGAGVFIALDSASGRTVWKQPVTLGAHASRRLILVGEGMLFYRGADNGMHAFDAATGREKWKTEAGGGLLAVHAGVLAMTDAESRLELRDASTGILRCKRTTGGSDATALADGDTLYLSDDGVHAISLSSGKELWTSKHDLILKRVFHGLLIGQRTYVRETVALRTSDGTKAWDVEGSVMGSHDGVLALERMDVGPEYRAHKIEAATGRELSEESQLEFHHDFAFHEDLTADHVAFTVPYADHFGDTYQRLHAYSREAISKDEWIEAREPGTGRLYWKTAKVWGWVSSLIPSASLVIRAETPLPGGNVRVSAWRAVSPEK